MSLGLNPPWACSFVLMTSSGHVTTPEAAPATAPQKLLTEVSEYLADHMARREGLSVAEEAAEVALLTMGSRWAGDCCCFDPSTDI